MFIAERRIEQKFNQKISTNHSVQAQEPSLMEPLNPRDESKLYTRITFVNKQENLNSKVS